MTNYEKPAIADMAPDGVFRMMCGCVATILKGRAKMEQPCAEHKPFLAEGKNFETTIKEKLQ